jgi:hypothetical protein
MFCFQIDVDIINEISEKDLQEYLPCKGDRIAVKNFAAKETKKSALIESLRSRMGIAGQSDSDDDIPKLHAPRKRNVKKTKRLQRVKLQEGMAVENKQAVNASKPDRALIVGFAIYDFSSHKYRQIRAPMGGGIRYPRVPKNIKKEELLEIVRPLFFPDGINMHGSVNDYDFNIATDVHGTHMMQNETIEEITVMLKLKHFRCYLLAKKSEAKHGSLDNKDNLQGSGTELVNKRGTDEEEDTSRFDEDSSDSLPDPLLSHNQMDASLGSTVNPELTESAVIDNGENIIFNQPVLDLVEFEIASEPSTSAPLQVQLEEMPKQSDSISVEELLFDDPDNSGVITFGPSTPNDTDLEKTLPIVCEIKVHRGRVCRDLIEFFSDSNCPPYHLNTFEMKMLKEDGTEELAEDNGGVMRDALSEFWETFYLQFTEGNLYKVPVIRHDMTEAHWRAVAIVIRLGFLQENVFPIRMAPAFMQQAIFGVSNGSDLIESFLRFVPAMDKNTLENALENFQSVDKEDILDVMDQYEAKKMVSADNVEQVIREIAHKELIQKPMFVADCFHKVLSTTPLVGEDMAEMYANLEPTPRKVMNSLQFPEAMSQEETVLSSYVKRLVREMEDRHYLELFLRFCTGSGIMTKKNIFVRFTCSGASTNVRSPTSHTCGCVLEIPKSYAQDPYVVLKSDFLSLLQNRYWQMDLV